MLQYSIRLLLHYLKFKTLAAISEAGTAWSHKSLLIQQRRSLNQPLGQKKIVTANGALTLPSVAVPWFNCLGVKRENYPVVGLDLPAKSFTDGLLGMDFLREVKAIIDVAQGEIRLGN